MMSRALKTSPCNFRCSGWCNYTSPTGMLQTSAFSAPSQFLLLKDLSTLLFGCCTSAVDVHMQPPLPPHSFEFETYEELSAKATWSIADRMRTPLDCDSSMSTLNILFCSKLPSHFITIFLFSLWEVVCRFHCDDPHIFREVLSRGWGVTSSQHPSPLFALESLTLWTFFTDGVKFCSTNSPNRIFRVGCGWCGRAAFLWCECHTL